MTATETLRTNPKYLDRLNQFLKEDEVGALFNNAITEFVLGQISTVADQSNHATIFRAGNSAGAARVRTFIDDLDPIIIAEGLKRKAADEKLRTPQQLPSAVEAQNRRLGK